MDIIYITINIVNEFLWGKNILVFLLLVAAIYLTIRTRFAQIRLFPSMIRSLTENEKSKKGGISSIESLFLSTASRVGAGNIVGVIGAISVGGAGSIFWMWIIAILGSATAFVESSLAVMYREKKNDNTYIGGTPYIYKNRLNLKSIGLMYAIFSIICYLGVTQVMSYSIVGSITDMYDLANFKRYISIALVILVALILFSKNKKKDSIISAINKIVPFMAILYTAIVIFILVYNYKSIIPVFKEIIEGAFGVREVFGGTFGTALMYGIRRGLFSNEAGSGNANYAASIVTNTDPVKQGFIQVIGVFIDTLVICSATAFIILLAPKTELSGMELFNHVMRYHLGTIGEIVGVILMFFFSLSTILAVAYYGKNALYFIKESKKIEIFYGIFIVLMVYMGAMIKNEFIWSLADFGLGLMTILNILLILPLSNESINKLNEYEKKKND
ncbi:alanine/glycine:cation symporter family protein [Oceanivirga miroungae]|uniref:Amino acid carrier protein n=1 Tax=Oceanivirga miroungae TaxID=1130046 RepID=A0A6I8M4G5_9FUSO|nr:amino acid carrier protein [Oceanivirga miroungae]VWL84794.1 amino acid carrier protein [Oceanivirga miroungae]